jgi:hypothetical protein
MALATNATAVMVALATANDGGMGFAKANAS